MWWWVTADIEQCVQSINWFVINAASTLADPGPNNSSDGFSNFSFKHFVDSVRKYILRPFTLLKAPMSQCDCT